MSPARWAFTPNLLPVDRGCPRKRLLQPERQAKAALQMKVSWIATGQNCPRLLGPWGMGHRYPPSAGLISKWKAMGAVLRSVAATEQYLFSLSSMASRTAFSSSCPRSL